MTSHERAMQLARVMAALLVEVRVECGQDKTVKMWTAAIKKGIKNEDTDKQTMEGVPGSP